MKKLVLHNIQEIDRNKDTFIKQNAFIRPDGTFYLAKGYTGCNPWHQLESSALWVGRQDIGYDFIVKYEEWLEKLKNTNCDEFKEYMGKLRKVSNVIGTTKLWDKRSVLVHFYGYVLFCRTEFIRSFKDREIFYENSLIPNPSIYGKEITLEQKEVLSKMFDINEGQNVSSYSYSGHISDRDEMLKLVLEHRNNVGNWHH